jgi:hypothetical protein
MTRRAAVACVALAAACLGGCARPRVQASPGLMGPEPVLTLGAGDALGMAVYSNDLVIAAREAGMDFAVTVAPEHEPIGLGD